MHSCLWSIFIGLSCVSLLVARSFFSLCVWSQEAFATSVENTFQNNQTLVFICSVLLVALQALIWQHAVLIWLSLHTTTEASNTWAPVSWTRNVTDPTEKHRKQNWRRHEKALVWLAGSRCNAKKIGGQVNIKVSHWLYIKKKKKNPWD